MYPYFKDRKKAKKKKCYIYKRTDGTDKKLNLKVHRSFLLFRYFNNKIPESVSPLIPTTIPLKEMNLIYKCVLFSYLSYKDRTKIVFPPEIKIEYETFESDVRRIPFFIATDSSTNAIIVSCRGSSCRDDFITDSLGNGVSYGGGRFHEGIFSTASYVFLTCQNKIIELNKLYNSNEDEYDDESGSDDSSSYKNSIDDSESNDDSEEETENEEEEEAENYFSFHKSTSNNELQKLAKSTISIQRSTSSEELNLEMHSISNSNLNPQIRALNKNEQNDKTKSNKNRNRSGSIRKSTSIDNLSSHRSGSISIQKSMSNEDLHLICDSNLKMDSNDDDDDFTDSKQVQKKNKSNKNTKSNLYQNGRNKQSNSTPILSPQKQMRRSTSEENLNSSQKIETVTISHKKSYSIANLQLKFQKLSEKHDSNRNADSENEPDSEFLQKMRKKRTKIVITGHSLGASVAAVVAYLFRQKFPELDVQCICFAPPPTMSFNLWRTTGKYIRSFMIEGDVVPFLSVRNLLAISDILFPHQHSNKKFKKLIISYLEKKSLENFNLNKALEEKLYPPGQMYLIRFTNDNEGGILTLRKRIKKLHEKRKRNKNLDDDDDIKDDEIQLCQILNPDYFSHIVKNIQENNHAVKNYMRLIIRLTRIFKKQQKCQH